MYLSRSALSFLTHFRRCTSAEVFFLQNQNLRRFAVSPKSQVAEEDDDEASPAVLPDESAFDKWDPQTPADSIVRVSVARNNIHATVSDLEGRVISRSSGGMVGFKADHRFKHRERSSPEASSRCAEDATTKAMRKGYKVCHLEIKGSSPGRGLVMRGILQAGMRVKSIRDTTPVPTPGVRPPAARRL